MPPDQQRLLARLIEHEHGHDPLHANDVMPEALYIGELDVDPIEIHPAVRVEPTFTTHHPLQGDEFSTGRSPSRR